MISVRRFVVLLLRLSLRSSLTRCGRSQQILLVRVGHPWISVRIFELILAVQGLGESPYLKRGLKEHFEPKGISVVAPDELTWVPSPPRANIHILTVLDIAARRPFLTGRSSGI